MKKILIFASFSEILYLSLSFFTTQLFGHWTILGELIRTLFRLVSLLYLGFCYKACFYISAQPVKIQKTFTAPFIFAVQLLLLFALLYSNAVNESADWQAVYFVCGLIAGLREELFYRGIVQKALQQRFGHRIALAVGTIVFTLAHLQYLYVGQFRAVLMIACAGLIFSSIFIQTGSVLFAALVHGLYDATLSINVMPIRLSYDAALPVMLMITGLFALIVVKTKPAAEAQDTIGDRDDYSLP